MTEEYLHFVWRKKRIPSLNLKLTDGRTIDVLHYGFYNSNQGGPDFSMGIILLDGAELVGPVEMHVKGSDWYLHKHHIDSNYDNVILHVVYENDRQVIQNGRHIPTLELKGLIDPVHKRNYYNGSFVMEGISCSAMRHDHLAALESMKIKAYFERLNIKLTEAQRLAGSSKQRVILRLLAWAFGTTVNRSGFDELCTRIPLSVIRQMGRNDSFDFICSQADLPHGTDAGRITWEFTGMRPQNSPAVRIPQFASCVALLFSMDAETKWLSGGVDFIREILQKLNSPDNNNCQKLSKIFIDHLLINVFIPAIYLDQTVVNEEQIRDRVIDELKSIRPESNKITRMWKREGVIPVSAFDSQALFALNAYYCSRKKCLSCDIGKGVINQVHDTENCFLF